MTVNSISAPPPGDSIMSQTSPTGTSTQNRSQKIQATKSSRNSRNPHASNPQKPLSSTLKAKCQSEEQLIFEQWKCCEGAPISEFATNGMFDIALCLEPDQNHTPGNYSLSDIRMWGPREFQPAFNGNKMRLEFFFDGYFDMNNKEQCGLFEGEMRRKLEENLGYSLQEEF